ncbi:N-substituted formamide deformylase [Pseudoclavibacter triregionum]|nr:N-substituted formamide deformylase [Pseudoclavibacter triregionum]
MRLDLLVRNAVIVTMDPDRPRASSLGVWRGRVVGLDEELEGLEAERVLDAGGRAIVPGFVDAHCHTTWWGLGLAAVDLSGVRSMEELYAALAAEAERLRDEQRPDERPAWIHATGYNHKHTGGELPDIDRLDEVADGHPVYLRHTSGHRSFANRAALALAGALDASFPDPEGGEIVRDERGEPTGIVDESAQEVIQALLLPYSAEDIADALDRATRRYAAWGITSFAEAGVGGGWIGHSPAELAAYRLAAGSGRLHARATLMPVLDALRPISANAADFAGEGASLGLDLGLASGFGDERVRIGHVKVFTDGSLLGATAAVTEDFCGHPHNRGYLLGTPEEYRERVLAAYRAGWSLALHAIGDRAVDLAIELIAEAQERYGRRDVPNRIEHCGIARPEHLPRLAELGIAVTPQASFIGPLGSQFMAKLGPERSPWLYRARSFLDAGVLVAGSSDLPVADADVLRAMRSLVDRVTDEGEVFGSREEEVTPEQALRMYTVDAARACGVEGDRGMLAPGRLADFVVLSHDPLSRDGLIAARVEATYLGGEATFAADESGLEA